MIHLEEIISQMNGNAQAVQALVQTISDEQAHWKPDLETWSMQEVLEHLFNEERIDFRKHLKEIFNFPPQEWAAFDSEELVTTASWREALQGFLTERNFSTAWLQALQSPDWNATIQSPFEQAGEMLVLNAGDILASWAAHDYLHLRQIIELQYAWNVKQSPAFSVEYAGGW